MTTKKGIFISHIHEEAALGAVVKEWVSDAFAGSGVNAFLSSDKQDLPAGRKWIDVIEKQLSDAGVVISLISPASLVRPWVNIELGAAWIGRVPIIPFCHSGQAPSTLPKPFGDFSAISLSDDTAATALIGGVADALQLTYPKRLPFAECLKEMRAAATSGPQPVIDLSATPSYSLPDEQIAILRALAEFGNHHGADEYIEGTRAAIVSHLKPMVFKHHSEQLEEQGLLYIGHWGEGANFKITGDGAGWLLKHNLMPD